MALFPLAIPGDRPYWLTQGRVPSGLLRGVNLPVNPALAQFPQGEDWIEVDVAIAQGHITAVQPAGTAPPEESQVPLDQGMIWPCWVDSHTHLDKGHTWLRTPNPDGTFAGALAAIEQDAAHWTEGELYRRMDFSLRCAYGHGTRALRTHLDAGGPDFPKVLGVLQQLQRDWRDRLELQWVSLVSLDYYFRPEGVALADLVAAAGGILGGVAYGNPELAAQVDRVFTLAAERGLALDLHVDESLDPTERSLLTIAQTKLRHRFSAPVTCGHCCALGVQPEDIVTETLHWVREAAIAIISLPLCNLYLQDRQPGRTPRYRGITLIQELAAAGIPVALASDNTRDPFYAYGDLDGLEVFTQGVRVGHLDRPIGAWAAAVTTIPAQVMGLPQDGAIAPGAPADLILFSARTYTELLSRPQGDRIVLRQGRPIDTTPPDYRELDDLNLAPLPPTKH